LDGTLVEIAPAPDLIELIPRRHHRRGCSAVVNRLNGVSVHLGGGATIVHYGLVTVGDVALLVRGLAQ
jgi:hypothetical protein